MKHRSRKHMPEGAKVLEWHGFLGFPTRVRYQLTNMEEVEWISRQQRKHRRLPFTGRTREWWESERISQWMCVLFMIGSFAFTLGALLCFVLSIPLIVPGVIFFAGSLFFTSAAYLQFLEAINVPGSSARALTDDTNKALYFNFSTFNAMRLSLSPLKSDRLVWSADFLGSVLFLVSSWLAYGEVASALTTPKLKSLTWWIVLSNLLGSVAFGISAITSFILPGTGTVINANVTNLTTAIGGACFFVGALLQLIETNRENAEDNKKTTGNQSMSPQGTVQLVDGQA